VVAIGDTEPLDTLPNPVLHAYVVMFPLPAIACAVKVVLDPLHIVSAEVVGATVGFAFTVMVILKLS